MSPSPTLPLLKVFAEARQWGRGGEVVVRSGAETGRVFFVHGKIAWATASTNRRTLFTHLAERSDLTKEQLQDVVGACKQTGDNFAETIIERGLLDEGRLRRCLLEHLSECLFEILCWPSAESMFVPDERPFKGSLTFELGEVLQAVVHLDAGGLGLAGTNVEELLDRLAKPEGAARPDDDTDETAGGSLLEQLAPTPGTVPDPSLEGPTEETLRPDEARRRSPRRAPPIALWAGGALALLALAGMIAWRVVETRSRKPAAAAALPAAPRTGRVKIASTPRGARVALDGVASGVTPTQIAGVEPSRKHALRVTLEGWQPWETRFVLTDTSRPLEFEALLRKAPASKPVPRTTRAARPESPAQPTLQVVVADAKGKGKGSVLVDSRPPRAEIYLDGIRTGKRTPATLRGVAAGSLHAVQVSLKGHAPSQKTVKPARNRVIKVQLVLKKGAQEEGGGGAVTLDSLPKGAVVLVNGKRQKQLTPVTLTLGTPSKLEVRHKGYKPWRRAVVPVQGVNLAYTARLKRR